MILHNATVDAILERRSVRSYAPQQITPDELETILEAGRSAPSGMNQQSAIAVAVQNWHSWWSWQRRQPIKTTTRFTMHLL